MTGPEHYREAERLLAGDPPCKCYGGGTAARRNACHHCAELTQRAQAHAVLALAAATALGCRERDGDHDPDGMDPADRLAWEHAASMTAPIREES